MNIGQAIKEFRKKRGISQVMLAKQIKIAATSLSQIECGVKNPGPKTIKKICDALEVPEPLIYLMAAEENDVPKNKKVMFNLLFPTIKGLVHQITTAD